MKKGYIYLIENDINDDKYVGQTIRDLQVRFHEHITDTHGYSYLHNAIQEYGYQHFSIKLLEEVDIKDIDKKEKEWIDKINSSYNLIIKNPIIGNNIWIVEKNYYVKNIEYLVNVLSNITKWSVNFLTNKFYNIVNDNKDFLGYHFKNIEIKQEEYFTDENILEDWAKTLGIIYSGKHVHCIELDRDFETIAAAGQYLLENNLYETQSKIPQQIISTLINQHLKGKNDCIKGVSQNYTFEFIPGVKEEDNKQIYCPELDKIFNSQEDAGHYFIDNKIWTGIKFKTAKTRISDVARGAFPGYKGYTFKFCEIKKDEEMCLYNFTRN